MIFKQLNPHACRTYLIGTEEMREIAIVDPVLDHLRHYIDLLKENEYKLTHVVDTHTHADHISGAAALKDLTDCQYAMHTAAPAQCPNLRVSDGYELRIAQIPVRVLHTPGHTIDSICLVFPDRILTGDTLFLDEGGAGRDDLPGGSAAAHWKSLQRIAELSDDLVVYPAHDYRNRNPSSLREQKRTNPHLQRRTEEEFIDYVEDLRLGPADWMKDVLKANYSCALDPRAAWVPVDAPACELKGTIGLGVNEVQVPTISSGMLKQKLISADPPLLLDVRERDELDGPLGHIDGIVHLPVGSISQKIGELENNKEREIVTVCRSGARAYTAAQILAKAGFRRVSVLAGGMIAWNN